MENEVIILSLVLGQNISKLTIVLHIDLTSLTNLSLFSDSVCGLPGTELNRGRRRRVLVWL